MLELRWFCTFCTAVQISIRRLEPPSVASNTRGIRAHGPFETKQSYPVLNHMGFVLKSNPSDVDIVCHDRKQMEQKKTINTCGLDKNEGNEN